MTIPSSELNKWVGEQRVPATASAPATTKPGFFAHVSEHVAYALEPKHPHGVRTHASDMADGLALRGPTQTLNAYYFSNERAMRHPAYNGDPANLWYPKAGERILVGFLSTDSVPGFWEAYRSPAGEGPYHCLKPDADGVLQDTGEAINPHYMPAGAVTQEFPAFDAYLMDPKCKCTVPIAKAAGMTAPGMFAFCEPETMLLPSSQLTKNTEWMLYIVPVADVPPNSFLRIVGTQMAKIG